MNAAPPACKSNARAQTSPARSHGPSILAALLDDALDLTQPPASPKDAGQAPDVNNKGARVPTLQLPTSPLATQHDSEDSCPPCSPDTLYRILMKLDLAAHHRVRSKPSGDDQDVKPAAMSARSPNAGRLECLSPLRSVRGGTAPSSARQPRSGFSVRGVTPREERRGWLPPRSARANMASSLHSPHRSETAFSGSPRRQSLLTPKSARSPPVNRSVAGSGRGVGPVEDSAWPDSCAEEWKKNLDDALQSGAAAGTSPSGSTSAAHKGRSPVPPLDLSAATKGRVGKSSSRGWLKVSNVAGPKRASSQHMLRTFVGTNGVGLALTDQNNFYVSHFLNREILIRKFVSSHHPWQLGRTACNYALLHDVLLPDHDS